YLLFPNTALWWLEFYANFRRHLETNYPAVLKDQGACLIFDVRERHNLAPLADQQSAAATAGNGALEQANGPGGGGVKLSADPPPESELRVELAEALIALGRYRK